MGTGPAGCAGGTACLDTDFAAWEDISLLKNKYVKSECVFGLTLCLQFSYEAKSIQPYEPLWKCEWKECQHEDIKSPNKWGNYELPRMEI